MAGLLADTAPLKNPDFRRLWLANIITVVGAQLTIVAVPAQIYLITDSSAYVGLTGVFGLVPLVVFGLWGGALADAMDRRVLLICTTIGLIACSALFWAQAAVGIDNVWLILALFSVQQAFFAVNQPTRTAILPRLLPARELPAALSLSMTVTQAGAIAGPLVGGALIPALGFPVLYLLDTIFQVPTLFAVLRLPSMKPDTDAPRAAGLRSVIDGLRYLSREKILLASFVVDLIAMILGMPRALFPQMAHENFGGPQEGGWAFALLFIAISAGAVLGGVFSGWVSRVRRQGLAVIVCILVWGAAVARGRAGGGVRGRVGAADPAGGAGSADDRRRRRHGVVGVPAVDHAGRRHRRGTRQAAGRVHRGGGGRAADRRRRARRRGRPVGSPGPPRWAVSGSSSPPSWPRR